MIGKFQFLRSLILSKKVNKKIIIIESDDWGSERIPNLDVRRELELLGVDMNTNPHARYDTLESYEDLIELEKILDYFVIEYNKKIKITANFITANPDFNRIKEKQYQEYFFEPFNLTYFNRDRNHDVLNQIKKMINKDYFQPQFHGREHINVNFWLEELKNQNQDFLNAFKLNCYAIDSKKISMNRKNLMAALEYENDDQKRFIEKSISIGHQIFKDVFGFNSSTFIAPRYVWSDQINDLLLREGFTHLQTVMYQQSFKNMQYETVFHYTGQKNKECDLKYLVRNVYFEPSYGKIDWVKNAMEKIDLAFKFKTPAIICMHRLNFVGGLESQNRITNLQKFKLLFELIINKYPDVQFLTSDELAKSI
jgi:hypothetical protein